MARKARSSAAARLFYVDVAFDLLRVSQKLLAENAELRRQLQVSGDFRPDNLGKGARSAAVAANAGKGKRTGKGGKAPGT